MVEPMICRADTLPVIAAPLALQTVPHFVPSHTARKSRSGLPPALVKTPPTYTLPARYAMALTAPFSFDAPSALQLPLETFHFAMWSAPATPPAEVKDPPTYSAPGASALSA